MTTLASLLTQQGTPIELSYDTDGLKNAENNQSIRFMDDVISRRIRYTRNWCQKHQKTHSFDHAFFPEETGHKTLLYRRVTLDPDGLKISPFLAQEGYVFSDAFESQIINACNDAVLLCEAEPIASPGPRIIYCNKAYETMTGYSAAEMLGNTPRILQGEQSSKLAIKNIAIALRKWQPIKQHIVNYRKNGDAFWVELNISPVTDETGWYSHWISIQRDLSMEITHQQHQYHMQRMMERSGVGTWIYDGQKEQFNFDCNGLALLNLDTAQHCVALSAVTEQLTKHHSCDLKAKLDEALNSVSGLEIVLAMGDDPTKYFQFKGERYFDVTQQHATLSGIMLDITKEKQTQLALQEQREAMIENGKLAALGRLAAGVAHEINNPLSVINVMLDILDIKLPAGDINYLQEQQFSTKLRDASERIEQIVSSLSDISKANRKRDTAVSVNVTRVTTETLALFHQLYQADGIQIIDIIPNQPAYVMAPPGTIQQVIVNLLNNARDAVSGNTSKRISVTVEILSTHVVLHVKDNGEGVPEAIQKTLYEPFVTTKPPGKGTGLGLSIVHGLISSLGGKITCHSADVGAYFSVSLPLCESIASACAGPQGMTTIGNNQNSTALLTASGSTVSCLVVDDNQQLAQSLSSLLTLLGCDTCIAESGESAIHLLKKQSFDLILTDIKMPSMDGWALLDIIHRENLAPDSLCYVISSLGNNGLKAPSVDSTRVNGILPKPVSRTELIGIIDAVKENRQQQQTLQTIS